MNLSDSDKTIKFTLESGENVRLDVYLSAETEFTRSHIKKLIDGGMVTINGSVTKCGRILKENDEVVLRVPDSPAVAPKAKEIPLEVLYEDDDIAVINKQRGLTVHPGAGNEDATLVGGLLWRGCTLSSMGGSDRPGIVHRLDKDTSGAIVVAKNDFSYLSLSRQFSARTVKKIYISILIGNPKTDGGILTTFIGRNPSDRKLMAVTKEGRIAITEYRILERFDGYCFAEFNLHTGRTHQIRVHAKYLGHPCLGDASYGGTDGRFRGLNGQLLHAKTLTIAHPRSGENMTFSAPVPEDFSSVLDKLRAKGTV